MKNLTGKIVTATKGMNKGSALFPCTGEVIETKKEGKDIFVVIKPLTGGPLVQTLAKNCHKPKLPHGGMTPSEAWARFLASGGKFAGPENIAKENFTNGFKAGKRKN